MRDALSDSSTLSSVVPIYLFSLRPDLTSGHGQAQCRGTGGRSISLFSSYLTQKLGPLNACFQLSTQGAKTAYDLASVNMVATYGFPLGPLSSGQ